MKLNVRVVWCVGVEETQGQGRGSRMRAQLQHGPPSAGGHQSGGELVFTVYLLSCRRQSWVHVYWCCRLFSSFMLFNLSNTKTGLSQI